jgi:hypothetical protein
MNVNNVHQAKIYLKNLFQEMKGLFSVDSLGQGKRKEHFEIFSKNEIYYCLYKRAFFYKFGKIFRNKNLTGVGESVNTDVLAYIIQWAIDWILFIYPDGKVYQIKPKEFQEFTQEYRTIRLTEDGEYTASIPIRLLKRFNP